MEKRFLLAVILSFFVLYAWSVLSPRPTPSPSVDFSQKKSLVAEPPETSETNLSSEGQDHVSAVEAKPAHKESLSEISTEKLILTFSDKGGLLKKIKIKDYDKELPVTDVLGLWEYNEDFFTAERFGDKIVYRLDKEGFSIVKSYEAVDDEYVVHSEIIIENKAEMSKKKSIQLGGLLLDMSSLDIDSKKSRQAIRSRSLYEYVVSSDKGFIRKNNAYKFSSKELRKENQKINWIGFRDRYFCVLIRPDYDFTKYTINPLNQKELKIDLESKEIKISPKESIAFSSLLYFGPEKLDILKKYDDSFKNIKKYYRFGIFDGIAKIINNIMQLLHKVVPSWGLCIIMMGLIIYFSMYPLTLRGMSSMKKMQALQPKIAALREKHKNNPQKLNKETMELYKENKINPLGGCLPLFLQMPVFIGLYQVLWRSVSFKGAHFLWIQDLSAPDRLFVLKNHYPLIGNEVNILPLIMMVIMFFQQKLSAKNMTVTDPAQASQQKMMSIFFPLFLGYIFYKFASGLTLYFTVFYCLSTFTQWKISKTKSS